MFDTREIIKNEMVTVHSEDLNGTDVQGMIIASNETAVVLACVDAHGENNGFLWLRWEGIYRVDYGSDEEKKTDYLYHLKKQSHALIDFGNQNNLMSTLLAWAYDNHKVVTLYFDGDEEETWGYLETVKPYRMELIDRYECSDGMGKALVNPEKSDYIRIDEKRSRDAELVYAYKRGMKECTEQ